jgi:RHS repeat-associated protein
MIRQLSETSHQGVDGLKAALYLGSMAAKSNTASGMQFRLRPTRIGSRSSGKERDAETGLDYFGARYYSGAEGRFISPDPIGIMKQKLRDPQQWNMYTYARNNPLRFKDPTGKYVTSCTEKDISKCDTNTQNFEKTRQAGLKSKDQATREAAEAYGAFGQENKVTVAFIAGKDRYTSFDRGANNQITGVTATFGQDRLVGINSSDKGRIAGAVSAVGHEGSHVKTDLDYIDNPRMNNVTSRQSEIRAYAVTAAVAKEAGISVPDLAGNPVDLSSPEKISNYLDSLPPDPRVKYDEAIDVVTQPFP